MHGPKNETVRFADAHQVLSSYLWIVCMIHLIKLLKNHSCIYITG